MRYKSSSFNDIKFLAYDVSRHYVSSGKMTSFHLQKNLTLLLNLIFMVQIRTEPILMVWSQFEQKFILAALL